MDEDQLMATIKFVDELEELGALEEAPVDNPILCNGLLLIIPKAGQPGQWRVLSDMKGRGQNNHIASDPVQYPKVEEVLSSLCPGGFSAVIDVSKMFYNFLVPVEDRKYLGLIHPRDAQFLRHVVMHMGSHSSPGLTGQK
eukprot:11204453-Ditylum_brightwellii.AAC.1